MRDLRELDHRRVRTADILERYGSFGDGTCGVFTVPYPKTGVTLGVVASSGKGWDHVSVSVAHRTPNWYEMQHIHRLFFRDDEIAWQFHFPKSAHISIHPNCLHLWRAHDFSLPRPPVEFV